MAKIFIVGSGFVGQATGKGLHAHGHSITFIDIDVAKVEALRAQQFEALTPAEVADRGDVDVSIITVSTPTEGGKINLNSIRTAAYDTGLRLARATAYQLVVIRSTIVPGTTENEIIPILEQASGKKVGRDFGVCMNPEFLRERTAEADFAHPWLIVIGQYDQHSGDTLAAIYAKFLCPIHRLSLREAEFQKYVHNLYNAVKISYFNELRQVAKQAGINPEEAFALVTQSAEGMWNPEYGTKNRGPFDGSCLPKDTQAFLQWATAHGWPMPLLKATLVLNQELITQTQHSKSIPAPVPAPAAVAM